jgi:hypothetical protein
MFSVVAQSSTLTLGRCIFVTMSSRVSCPFPAREYTPVPRDNPSPPRLGSLSNPDHRPPPPNIKDYCCISPPPYPIGCCIVVAVSSPRSSVDCCFDPRTRLMLPPMASSSISAAAVVFRRYRPMPLSSYDAPLSAVDTDQCRICRAAVAFAVTCHHCTTLPS